MSKCTNLPETIERNDFDKFQDYFNEVCKRFQNSVIGQTFNGRIIKLQHPVNNKTIWHILSKEDLTSHRRVFDSSRAAKTTWISYLLYASTCTSCEQYNIWAKKHNGKSIRWFIFCKTEKYVIILEEYGSDVLYLITAFNVTPQKEREFLKNYAEYINFGIT